MDVETCLEERKKATEDAKAALDWAACGDADQAFMYLTSAFDRLEKLKPPIQ